MTAFWEPWAAALTKRIGSGGTEILGGALLAGLVAWLEPTFWIQVALCAGAAVFYEGVLDPNGWNWTDVAQRAVGIAAGLGIAIAIRGHG